MIPQKIVIPLLFRIEERIGPKIVFVRRWAVGVPGNREGWDNGWKGRGKQGQFTINLRRRRTVPVTAGGRQVSEKGAMGSKESKGSKGRKEITPCIYTNVMNM